MAGVLRQLKSLLAKTLVTTITTAGTATLTGINQLHAGDGAKTANLLFTYTPIETIIDGELKFSVPFGMG